MSPTRSFESRLDIYDILLYRFEVLILDAIPGYKINLFLQSMLDEVCEIDKLDADRFAKTNNYVNVAGRGKIVTHSGAKKPDRTNVKFLR